MANICRSLRKTIKKSPVYESPTHIGFIDVKKNGSKISHLGTFTDQNSRIWSRIRIRNYQSEVRIRIRIKITRIRNTALYCTLCIQQLLIHKFLDSFLSCKFANDLGLPNRKCAIFSANLQISLVCPSANRKFLIICNIWQHIKKEGKEHNTAKRRKAKV